MIKKWIAFFFPVPGWKKRFRLYRAGSKMWEAPKPGFPPVGPFPVEWIPHSLEDSLFSEAERGMGFHMTDSVCTDTGVLLPKGIGVRCCRCGVDLHPDAADMIGDHDIPKCRRCAWVLPFYR